MNKWVKRSLWLVGIGLIAGLTTYYKMQPVPMETVAAKKADVIATVEEKAVLVNNTKSNVTSEVQGKVKVVPVEVGDTVTKGAILAEIDDSALRAQLAQLSGELKALRGSEAATSPQTSQNPIKLQENVLAQAEIALSDAEQALVRAKSLFIEGAITQEELERKTSDFDTKQKAMTQAETALNQAKLDYQASARQKGGVTAQFQGQRESLQAKIDELKLQMQKTRIKAAQSGIVLAKTISTGDYVTPGTPMFILGSSGKYNLEAYLITKDIVGLQQGTKVVISFKVGDKDVFADGEISKIAPLAEERISSLGISEDRVKITINLLTKPEGVTLISGMNANVVVVTQRALNVVSIPKDSVFLDGGKYYVWLVSGGQAKLAMVTKGIEGDNLVEIKNGLTPDDHIIFNPHQTGLKAGLRIKETSVK